MLKKTITYIDFDDNERTEDFYFNISKAEAAEMEMSVDGGLTAMINRITSSQDNPKIFQLFKEFILKSYGQKSPDGKRFEKSEEISKAFSETGAYEVLFMEIATDPEKAADFFNGVIPTPDDKKSAIPAPPVNS